MAIGLPLGAALANEFSYFFYEAMFLKNVLMNLSHFIIEDVKMILLYYLNHKVISLNFVTIKTNVLLVSCRGN